MFQTDPHSPIKIVYFGTPEFSAIILENIIRSFKESEQFVIQAVITQPDKPVGRKQVMTPSPVSEVATKYAISILKPEKIDSEFIQQNRSLLDSDLFIVAAYGKIISQEVLNIPTKGAINVHPSLLPLYRGASPIQTAILNGDAQTGVTIMLMDAKMDHGPTLSVETAEILPTDTYESLSKRLAKQGAELLIKTIQGYVDGTIAPKEQNHEKATFTKLIAKEEGYFDIENPPSSEQLSRMIRAFYPWPNVWTRWNGKVVKFYPENLVQMEGKNPTELTDFLRGYPNFPIKNF